MPKPMLRQPEVKQQTNSMLNARMEQKQNQQQKQMSKLELDRLLRKPRSKRYMDAVHCLDAGGHVHNQHKVDAILAAIREEFPEVEITSIMLGIVDKCYLGRPYEVHTLDVAGSIIEHYKRSEVMPNGLEKARGIAMHGNYDFIEVYIDCCRAVSSNGSVSVIVG